jgi:hypothetical protein
VLHGIWITLKRVVFRSVRKIAKKCHVCPSVCPSVCPFACPSVCPSVRMEQFGSHWTDFIKDYIWQFFQKHTGKIPVSLKSDRDNGYFTWRPVHIHDIALSYSSNEKCCRQKLYTKSNHTFCIQLGLFFWPASWSSGRSIWLLITRSRFRFAALPWEFSM